MKRILPAFITALLIHLALLKSGTDWLVRQDPIAPRTQITTMRLVERQPLFQPAIRPVPAPPVPLPPEPKRPPLKKPLAEKPVINPKPFPEKPKPVATEPPVLSTTIPDSQATARPLEPERKPPPSPAETEPAGSSRNAAANPVSPSLTAEPQASPAASAAMTAVVMARPRYSQNPPPTYPSTARRRKIQGTVILEVFVEKNGRVGDLRIAESSNSSLLDRAAMKTVNRWLFEPGRRGNRTAAMWVRVPIRFQLN